MFSHIFIKNLTYLLSPPHILPTYIHKHTLLGRTTHMIYDKHRASGGGGMIITKKNQKPKKKEPIIQLHTRCRQ